MKNKRVKSQKSKVERGEELNIYHSVQSRAAEQPSSRAAKQKDKGKRRKLNSVALINGKIILGQDSFEKSLKAEDLETPRLSEMVFGFKLSGFKGEMYDFH